MVEQVKKTEFDESTEVVAAEDCLSTTLDGESVILHMDAGEYYGFNEVATCIWDRIQEPRTIKAICEYVTTEYDVSFERGRADTEALVAELDEKGLVEIER
jgi:hypothetical protein